MAKNKSLSIEKTSKWDDNQEKARIRFITISIILICVSICVCITHIVLRNGINQDHEIDVLSNFLLSICCYLIIVCIIGILIVIFHFSGYKQIIRIFYGLMILSIYLFVFFLGFAVLLPTPFITFFNYLYNNYDDLVINKLYVYIASIIFFVIILLFIFQNAQLKVLVTDRRSASMHLSILNIITILLGMFFVISSFYMLTTMNASSFAALVFFLLGGLSCFSVISSFIGTFTHSSQLFVFPIFISFILATLCFVLCILSAVLPSYFTQLLVYLWPQIRIAFVPGDSIRNSPAAFESFLYNNIGVLSYIFFSVAVVLFMHAFYSLMLMTLHAGTVLDLVVSALDEDKDGSLNDEDIAKSMITSKVFPEEDYDTALVIASDMRESLNTEYALTASDLDTLVEMLPERLEVMNENINKHIQDGTFLATYGVDNNSLTEVLVDRIRIQEEPLYAFYLVLQRTMKYTDSCRGLKNFFKEFISGLILCAVLLCLLFFSIALIYLNICSVTNFSKVQLDIDISNDLMSSMKSGLYIQHNVEHGVLKLVDSQSDFPSMELYRCAFNDLIYSDDPVYSWNTIENKQNIPSFSIIHYNNNTSFFLNQDFYCPTINLNYMMPKYNVSSLPKYILDLSSSLYGSIEANYQSFYSFDTLLLNTLYGSIYLNRVTVVSDFNVTSKSGDITLNHVIISPDRYATYTIHNTEGIVYISDMTVTNGKLDIYTKNGFVNITSLILSTSTNIMINNEFSYTFINGMRSYHNTFTSYYGDVYAYGLNILDGNLKISTRTGNVTLENCDLGTGNVYIETITGPINLVLPTQIFLGRFTIRSNGLINISKDPEIIITKNNTNVIEGVINCDINCSQTGEILITSDTGTVNMRIY